MVKTEKAPMVAALFAVLWAFGAPAVVEASLPMDAPSSRVFKAADPFTTAPQMDLPSLTQQLRAIEERTIAASECVALCELAAGIEAHPFGVASAEPLNRSEDAWGNYRFSDELAPSKNRFGFTGHYWDNEAGLYYARARFYDPQTARFTQSDSFLGDIDDPPSLHRYQYAASNPTMFVDVSGNDFSLNADKKYGIDGVAAPVLSGKITDRDLKQYGAYAHRFGTRDDELQAIALTSNAYTQSWGKEVINLELSGIAAILPAEVVFAKAGALLEKGRRLAALGLRLLGSGVGGGVQQGTKSALDGNGPKEIAEDTGVGFGVGLAFGLGFEAFGSLRGLIASRGEAAESSIARVPTARPEDPYSPDWAQYYADNPGAVRFGPGAMRNGELGVPGLSDARVARLSRPGYQNYRLQTNVGTEEAPVWQTHYNGYIAPNQSRAAIIRRHAKTVGPDGLARYDPVTDRIVLEPGTRMYGQARLMEHRRIIEDQTHIGRVCVSGSCRGNNQRGLQPAKLWEYEAWEALIRR